MSIICLSGKGTPCDCITWLHHMAAQQTDYAPPGEEGD